DDWRTASVPLRIPILKKYRASNDGAQYAEFSVKDFTYRPLCGVMKAIAEKDPCATRFVYAPYEEFVRLPNGEDLPVHGELYATPEWREEHERVVRLHIPTEHEKGGGNLPRAIFAIMLGSDETLLAQFGTSSAWPEYLMAGNQTKYERAKPSMHAVHQIAYFVRLPDAAQDFIRTHSGGAAAKRALLTHCKRELMHESWKILLDDEFIEAYEWGMEVDCADGVRRLLFPRIFTYSADYPEKCIIATVKDLGRCPCPRCLITKDEIPKVGQQLDIRRRTTKARTDSARRQQRVDMARKVIEEHGIAVDSKTLDPFLGEESLNAFSERLGSLLFDFFRMLVVDLLHEFEIGVWKAIFIHMLRILQAEGGEDLLAELNQRFRELSTFGRATIRKFHNNVAEMKRLAARDFEDILIVAIPVFDRLLPEPFNGLFMDLLFDAAWWHSLAKLRQHTSASLADLTAVTTSFTNLLRRFEKETAAYNTKELPREARARQRRAANTPGTSTQSSSQPRRFNLSTYKIHSLPDYPPTIARLGTTDSWTTRLTEMTHRYLKRANRVTNHHQQSMQLAKKRGDDLLPYASPEALYHVAHDQKHPVGMSHFTRDNKDDPATKNFFKQLKSHVLERLGISYDLPDEHYSEALRQTVVIEGGRLYDHKTLRVNYTTYDLRRDQDSINPRTSHRDIMMLSPEDRTNAHPYWYARVLRIFHVNVLRTGADASSAPIRLDVLWIRWFGEDPDWQDGWSKRRLPRVGFVPIRDPDAFGFIDPATVLRASYLMPAFSEGRTSTLLPFDKSIARRVGEKDDFVNYYVGVFVDRDMMLRY
ncbi:hypothetical protein EXIGLDRAFT_571190, partial [Exidia glandulosa HHB12029]